ncbi:protein of unknown function [Methylocaldum szegediense]|uniref:Uncharacterized protein n=1 Tax=Methylocaldum szegediense TaxID=73780 RepID=A0ABM9I8L2_9GAMM|nr:protein of unknown function [Methylocaldum szegediense]
MGATGSLRHRQGCGTVRRIHLPGTVSAQRARAQARFGGVSRLLFSTGPKKEATYPLERALTSSEMERSAAIKAP